MIAAGKEDIRKWFKDGVKKGQKYMLIVYDRMDYPDDPDSPYYAEDAESAWKKLKSFRHDVMCEVMEVYDLSADMEAQLSVKRAWNMPEPPDVSGTPDSFPAGGLLSQGETRLDFMEAKNTEFIKEYFKNPENVAAYPVYVFTDDSNEYIYPICVYFLERKEATEATAAAVYRFTADGGAQSFGTLLVGDVEDSETVWVPLPQHNEVTVDDPYISFSFRCAYGKDRYSSSYRQHSTYTTREFSDDYKSLWHKDLSGGPVVDRESHELYERAAELKKSGGASVEVIDLLHKAADEGHGDAALELGNIYGGFGGPGFEPDLEKAAYWHKRAALLGCD